MFRRASTTVVWHAQSTRWAWSELRDLLDIKRLPRVATPFEYSERTTRTHNRLSQRTINMSTSNIKTENAVVSRGLTKCYGGRPVVHGLNLTIPTGSVYGLLGRNGAGKLTTIRMLTGMVRPDGGDAKLLGESIAELSLETQRRIGCIAEGHPLYGGMTIASASRFTRSFYSTWNEELFDQIIDHFELPRNKKLRKFPNGQRPQISLALAVAPDPELLILDDPTLGLDTVVRRDFLESMIQLIQREGRTILFSSHILGDVARVADRIGILVDGVLRVDCPTDHFKQSLRKIVLEFDRSPKEFPHPDGVISDRVVGTRRELVIANYSQAHRDLAKSLNPLSINEIELNLEDAFIEYTRGRRRSFPIFQGETIDVSRAGV
jgi:ABC-2 type transport system ATP-binding protein